MKTLVVYDSLHGNTKIVAEGQGFFVTESEGPLEGGEVERAKVWGAELVESIRVG